MDERYNPNSRSDQDIWADLKKQVAQDAFDAPGSRSSAPSSAARQRTAEPNSTSRRRVVEQDRRPGSKKKRSGKRTATSPLDPGQLLLPFAFFTCSLLLMELVLRLCNGSVFLLGPGFLRSIFSCGALGAALCLISSISPNKKVARITVSVVLFLVGAFTIAECCVKDYFGTYFLVGFMFNMTGDVAGTFLSETIGVVISHLWVFPLCLAPFVCSVVFRRRLVPKRSRKSRRMPLVWAIQLVAMVVLQVLNVLFCHVGNVEYYTYEFTANSSMPRYGIVNCLRLELEYAIFGQPEAPMESDDITLTVNTETETATDADDPEAVEEEEEEEEIIIEYDDNILDIDFESLIASDTSSTLKSMDEYFSSQVATSQNAYTGYFEGKNLIMITAEGFSYAVIDKDLTPALYQLTTSGFVFTNFYQPDYTQSTTGGEFALMTGILPTWIDGGTAFKASSSNNMVYGLGWMFQSLGYTTLAYHNNSYTYYGRNLTHPNLGYTFIGVGNGLEIESSAKWPASDLEMFEATIGDLIDAYVNDGTLFHTYYMTVSGHCNYGWNSNKMSLKNQDAVTDLNYSETVQAYIACQLELEYALEYLLEALEEAGIADDTVIVMAPDHYPYALLEDDVDYYAELTGNDANEYMTSRYENTLILWSGCMEEAVVVDTPCTGIDVLPTLLNLFGMEYDSRLLSGRDILAPDVEVGEVASNMHVAIFANTGYGYSWVTNAGTYEAYTKTFTPAAGVVLEDEESYITAVTKLVTNRYSYAKYLVTQNYYKHIFPNWKAGVSLSDAL